MPLTELVGHHRAREQTATAISANALPQVLLVSGAPGIGKQRFALWLAQRLLCTAPSGNEPCGRCASCLKVLGLAHPDLHWIVPILRPKATEPDKQVEEAGLAMEALLAERRKDPLWLPVEGMANHGIASARLIQRRAALTAAEGGARVFIISHAERLVPQEASQEGANALLKLLEEPPGRCWFILTTTTPGQVLPTILSRSAPLRLNRLSDQEVTSFLQRYRPELADPAIVALAHGAIGEALLSGSGGNPADQKARDWLQALAAGVNQATEKALQQGPWQARGDFTLLLDALADNLEPQAREALTQNSPAKAQAALAGVDAVLAAREQAQGNINPQLLLAVLGDQLNSTRSVS